MNSTSVRNFDPEEQGNASSSSSSSATTKKWRVAAIIFGIFVALTAIFSLAFFNETLKNNFSPHVSLVSASASSNGTTTIPAQWTVALNLKSKRKFPYQVDRVEASVMVNDSVSIATADRFTTKRVSSPGFFHGHDVRNLRSLEIHMRTKEGDLGRQAHGLEDFGVLALAWVHTKPTFGAVARKRSFFARFTCHHPFSVGADGSVVSAGRRSKCGVEVIRQSKMDESWTRLNMTRHR